MTANIEKSSAEVHGTPMSKCRIMKNLIIICLGFLFLFCAFQSLASLQTTINQQGSLSQSLIYACLAISSLLLPKLLISKLGCKATLVISIATYIPFMASNYYNDFLTQILTSILLGLGGATLWASACTYINEISVLYASHLSDSVDVITTRFFGIFFMIFQNSQIWGNLATFYILRPTDEESLKTVFLSFTNVTVIGDSVNSTVVTCGANFCGGLSRSETHISETKRFILISVYLGFTALSAIIVAVFLDPLQRKDLEKDSTLLSRLTATVKHLSKPDQLLLIPITIFCGFQQAFILSEFSQAYIACAWGVHNVSLVFIFFGAVNSVASFLVGRIAKYIPRLCVLLTGAMGNTFACIILFLWDPDGRIIYYFIVIGLWGLSDAIWQTEINSMYGILFRSDEEAAYGNLRLWEAIGFFLPYFFNTLLCMSSKLYFVIILLTVSITGAAIVEVKTSFKKKSIVITKL